MDEIRKISSSIGNFNTLLLSGGEPFLREDILEICRLFIEQNKIAILAVPTNGTQTQRVIEFAENILKEYPGLILSIAVSLDGFKETHDKIRGVEGVFEKAAETLNQLSKLKSRDNKLEVVINTVISKQNINELESFMDFAYNNLHVDYHEFELLRGDYKDKNIYPAGLDEIRDIHRRIARNRERYLKRDNAGLLDRLAVIGLLLFTQKIKESVLDKKNSPFICSAGRNIGVIDANGDVRLCELLPSLGNLKDTGYDFMAIRNSSQSRELRKEIIRRKCSCTHICFIKLTAARYLSTFFYLISTYLNYKIKNGNS